MILDTSVRQHYKTEHRAPHRNQTPSWYDWKLLKSTLNPNKVYDSNPSAFKMKAKSLDDEIKLLLTYKKHVVISKSHPALLMVLFHIYILGQKSNGPLQTMDCKMPPVMPIFINRISHSSAATARQYWTNFNHYDMTKIVSEAVQRDKGQLSKRANRNKGNVTYQQTANMKHRRLETAASKWNWTSIARLYWEVTLHSNKTRRPATLFHHFDIMNSFWPVKLYSIFDQHLDLIVSIASHPDCLCTQ